MKNENLSTFDKITENLNWQEIWEKTDTNKLHTIECDDAESFMSVGASCDGDFHLILDRGRNQIGMHPSFRARTFDGGGRNERVRIALALLTLAIIEDKE